MEKKIYIIHENDEWLIPLRESFKKIKAPYKEWHMNKIETSEPANQANFTTKSTPVKQAQPADLRMITHLSCVHPKPPHQPMSFRSCKQAAAKSRRLSAKVV